MQLFFYPQFEGTVAQDCFGLGFFNNELPAPGSIHKVKTTSIIQKRKKAGGV
jgi:hypothetical protein